jgi:phosphoserine phosphatase
MKKSFKIVSFDMDGTLTLGTTSLQFYVTKLHQEKRAKELEDFYKNHKIDDFQVADAYAEILKGTSRRQLDEWTKEIPKVKNIGETVRKIKELGLIVGITSVGPYFTSEAYQNFFGFDFISGSQHEFENGIHTGRMIKTLTGEDKVKILAEICKKYQVSFPEVIAVGDSRSDIPIFENAGYDIALNADENLRGRIDSFVKSDDLLEVYKQIKSVV